MKQDTDNIVHSDEVQEIMGYIPNWIFRVGISLLFLVVILVIVGSYFFKYPEVDSAPLILTTINSPAPLNSKMSGRIEKWFVSDGDSVVEGSSIALLKSTADFADIILVGKSLEQLTGDWLEDVRRVDFPRKVNLGTIQDSYLGFYNSFVKVKYEIEQNSVGSKIEMLNQLIEIKVDHYNQIVKQKLIKEEKYKIAKTIFFQDSSLYTGNRFGIPKREYDLARHTFLIEQENYMSFLASLRDLEAEILQMRQSVNTTRSAFTDQLRDNLSLLNQNEQLLESQINSWKESYLMTSPIRGKVTLTKFWSPNQVVNLGDRLATIVPTGELFVVGKALISSTDLGKVEKGQPVKIKLAGFPYLQYGTLSGKIRTISLVPENNKYVVDIELKMGMVSNFNEHLKFIHEMEGTAEIVTKDTRLINRLFNPLHSFFANNRN